MDHRIPRIGLLISLVCSALAVLTFIYLNEAFKGPSPTGAVASPYKLQATFRDTEVLQTKFNVVVRGVIVGKVTKIDYDRARERAVVTFGVDRDKVTIHRDAKALIGEFSLLGDPYIDLDPGTAAAGAAPSGTAVQAVRSVNFDEALDFLDARGRTHARRVLHELTAATRIRNGGGKLNATIGAISEIVPQLRGLTDALRGQESDLAALVEDSATVLGVLGDREASVRTIGGAGRVTLDALAADTRSLEQGVAALPGLLSSATRALEQARPLLVEAGPVVRDLDRVAPDLADVLTDLPQFTSDAVDIGSRLSQIPTLRGVLELERRLRPMLPALEAAVRNIVPTLQYAAPRAQSIGAFFANFAAATRTGNADGHWARIFFDFEPGEFNDLPTPTDCSLAVPPPGVCHNAYPTPGDALSNKPYTRGSYPRLLPFTARR